MLDEENATLFQGMVGCLGQLLFCLTCFQCRIPCPPSQNPQAQANLEFNRILLSLYQKLDQALTEQGATRRGRNSHIVFLDQFFMMNPNFLGKQANS